MSNIKKIKSKTLTWLNIYNAGDKEIDQLRKQFGFNELDLMDAYGHKHAQRPKIDVRDNYMFLVFLFPYYNDRLKKIEPRETDIFVTADHLITLQNFNNGEVNKIFSGCEKDSRCRAALTDNSPLFLLYRILEKLYGDCFPMIDHMSEDITHIEDNIYAKKERQIVEKVLIIKRNIINFLKIMQPHKRILRKITITDFAFIENERQMIIYFNDLIDMDKNIWDTLINYQQTIDNLEDTNNILVSFKLNDIMKTLTIFSVIVFPLTLVAAVFGMNVSDIPIVGEPHDFLKILGIMAFASLTMLSYFKYKKWI